MIFPFPPRSVQAIPTQGSVTSGVRALVLADIVLPYGRYSRLDGIELTGTSADEHARAEPLLEDKDRAQIRTMMISVSQHFGLRWGPDVRRGISLLQDGLLHRNR